MNENYNFTIFSNIPFHHNINTLNFKFNNTINYNDLSHANYIYKFEKDIFIYIFIGFFKNDFFIILCDIYDKNLNITIKDKNVIIIQLKWILIKYLNSNTEEKDIYFIDNSCFYESKNTAILINNRKKIFETQSIEINDYLKIYKFKIYDIKLYLDPVDTNQLLKKKRTLLKNFFSNLIPKSFI